MTFPLETWRKTIGYNPYHFYGLANSLVPVTSSCNTLVQQYSWQNIDAMGRYEILESIRTAEARLFEYLGFRITPEYVEKILQYPRPYDRRQQYGRSVDADGRWLPVNVDEGYIKAVGIEAFTDIDTGATVTYSDRSGDGLIDTFTISAATTVTDPSEIAVYFVAADRLDGSGRIDQYRIQPINVSISGGTVTITGRAWLCVRPIKYEGVNVAALDPNDTTASGPYAQTLDIARRYTNPAGTTVNDSQAMLIWETDAFPPWACWCGNTGLTYNTNSRDPAAQAFAIARAGIRNPRLGEIAPAEVVYNETTGEFSAKAWGNYRQPDRVVIRYLAGANLSELSEQITYSGEWDRIIARLAAAEMARRICACDSANRQLYDWQIDLAQISGRNEELYRISEADLGNPFGTRRGAIYAWKQVKNLKLTRAFVA